MVDPYVWLDPMEFAERRYREGQWAGVSEGREQALRTLSTGPFREALFLTASRLGHDVARGPQFAKAAEDLAGAIANQPLETLLSERYADLETVVTQRLHVNFEMSVAVRVRS